jgi:hypothetical protein
MTNHNINFGLHDSGRFTSALHYDALLHSYDFSSAYAVFQDYSFMFPE